MFNLYFDITGQQLPLVIGFFAEYCLGPSLPLHFNLIGSYRIHNRLYQL